MERADHHANGVKEIALALTGAILWRKEDDDPIKVMTYNGETKNVLWARINGARYAFSYNHTAGEIELRKGSTQGGAVHSFSNSTPLCDIYRIFATL